MNTKEKLKKILFEWAEYEIPYIYKRSFNEDLLERGEILSIIGARRTGKTYLCYQIINQLKDKVGSSNVIYINFEDERLYPIKGDELTLLWDVCQEIFDIDMSKKVYLFLDEIQNISNWSKWARRISDHNTNLKIIITGSSSKLLSKEISTELRGRAVTFTVFPLSFKEYLGTKDIKYDIETILYSKKRALLKREFNNYLQIGGFPGVIATGPLEHLLNQYYSVMYYRDIVERHKVMNIKLLEDFLSLMIDQIACNFSVSSTAKKLIDFGHSFSKNTLSNFLKYSEDAFLAFSIQKHSYKLKEQIRSHRKIYIIDHGLFQAIRFCFSQDYGRLMENMAFINLKRQNKDIYYYKGKRECDFITQVKGSIREAIQVTKSIANHSTKIREIEGLIEACRHYKLKTGTILTDDEYEILEQEGIKVYVMPLWYWLLTA